MLHFDAREHCGALGNPSSETYNHHWTELEWLRNTLLKHVMPWNSAGPTCKEEMVVAMKNKYERVIGDPDSPEFQARVARLLDYWKRLEQENAK